jgi:hypothetical protein
MLIELFFGQRLRIFGQRSAFDGSANANRHICRQCLYASLFSCFQPTTANEDSSDSGSELGNDDYETVYVECPADLQAESIGHVLIRADESRSRAQTDSAGVPVEAAVPQGASVHQFSPYCQSTGSNSCLLANGTTTSEEGRTANSVTIIGLNNYAPTGCDSFNGVIRIWKSYGNEVGATEGKEHEETQQPQEQLQSDQHQQPQSSATDRRASLSKLPSFEEVSFMFTLTFSLIQAPEDCLRSALVFKRNSIRL